MRAVSQCSFSCSQLSPALKNQSHGIGYFLCQRKDYKEGTECLACACSRPVGRCLD